MTPTQKRIREGLNQGLSTYKQLGKFAQCDQAYCWQYIGENSELFIQMLGNKKQARINRAKYNMRLYEQEKQKGHTWDNNPYRWKRKAALRVLADV